MHIFPAFDYIQQVFSSIFNNSFFFKRSIRFEQQNNDRKSGSNTLQKAPKTRHKLSLENNQENQCQHLCTLLDKLSSTFSA